MCFPSSISTSQLRSYACEERYWASLRTMNLGCRKCAPSAPENFAGGMLASYCAVIPPSMVNSAPVT